MGKLILSGVLLILLSYFVLADFEVIANMNYQPAFDETSPRLCDQVNISQSFVPGETKLITHFMAAMRDRFANIDAEASINASVWSTDSDGHPVTFLHHLGAISGAAVADNPNYGNYNFTNSTAEDIFELTADTLYAIVFVAKDVIGGTQCDSKGFNFNVKNIGTYTDGNLSRQVAGTWEFVGVQDMLFTAWGVILDTTSPFVSGFSSNATITAPAYNDYYNISFACSDETAVSCSWHQTRNGTGSINSTPDCSTPESYYRDIQNIHKRGETVYLKPYCNDTFNNVNTTVSEIDFTVANTPPQMESLLPTDNYHSNINLSVNFTYADVDGDDGNCYLYVNDSLKASQSSIADSTLVKLSYNVSDDGHYDWFVNCTDLFELTTSAERLFVLDTINPIITWVNPASDNTTISRQELSLEVSCLDEYLYQMLVNVTDSLGNQIHSNLSEATGTTFTTYDTVSLTEEGNYTVIITCSDQHTAAIIPDYGVVRDVAGNKLTYDTGDNTLSVSLNGADITLDDFSTTKLTDRYAFTYDFSSTANDETSRTFIFVLEAEQPLTYLENSQFDGHFISGTNWIDFELDDEGARYSVARINDNQYEISLSTTETLLNFNSIGGLNIVEERARYTYDITAPVWSNNLINNSNPHVNEWVKYSVFWEDNYALDYVWLEHNLSGGSLTVSDITNLAVSQYNFTVEKQVTAEPGEIFCLRTYANDTAGNQNVSSLDCYTVQNIPPVVNSVSATSPNGLGEEVVITANITDPDGQPYVSLVKVGIIPPGETETNYTMWNISFDTWTLNNFTDYKNGTYSYTVYAVDSGGLSDSSSGTFEMYDNLTISIFPLKSTYSGNELVSITDPPGEWLTKTSADFDTGTYSQTYYNMTVAGVMLNAGQSTGTYTSKVFDAGSATEWNSLAWSSGMYQQELSGLEGNVLLLHMNNNWNDSSGRGNSGTAYGDAAFSTSSKLGSHAGSFDGDGDYASTLTTNFPTGSSNISVEAWFKIDDLNSDNAIVTYGTNAANSAIQLVHRTSDDKLVLHYWGGYGTVTASLNDNSWHHAVGIHAGNNNYLYLDGSLAGNTAYSSANLINSFNDIGKVPGFSSYDFDGLIDELAVYNRTLSTTEILEHYKRGALRLNLSVRSCDDAVCSGESFVDVNDSSPQNLNLVNNTFFQFNFDFSTENISYPPELYNVTVSYTLEVPPENQSKLRNDLNMDTSIYLLMKVQYWNSSAWMDESTRFFSLLTIQPGEANQIKLDQYWQNWSTFDRIAYGVHRVYAAAVDDENQTVTNYDGSLVEAYHNFTVVNTAPTVPTLLFPQDGDTFGVLPEFNWSNSYDVDADTITYSIEIDDNSDFSSVTYSNSSVPEDASGVSWVIPALPIRYNYYWKVRANDGYADSNWSSVRNFTYAMWNVTFNVTSGEFAIGELNNVNISSCTYTGFNQLNDPTPNNNTYGPYGFPPGSWTCTFKREYYYDETKTFIVNEDKIVDVTMSIIGSLTDEEHTWLEALYNCIILKDCDLYNLLLQINQTVGNTWQQVKPTDASVITSEIAVSNTLNSTSDITYDYIVNIPIKAGYNLGAYLPVRIGFWFMDGTNTTCYNQGTLPTGVTLINPYCQPLMVETIGPMGGDVSFTVDLRPNLTAGTYNVKRIIEIDPLGMWNGYGQEVVGRVIVTEDAIGEGNVNLEKTGETMPNSGSGSGSSSGGGGSGGGGGGSKSSTNIVNNIINNDITDKIKDLIKEILNEYERDKENEKEIVKTEEKLPEKQESELEKSAEKSGPEGITGAVIGLIDGTDSNLVIVGILAVICLLVGGILGNHYAKRRRPPEKQGEDKEKATPPHSAEKAMIFKEETVTKNKPLFESEQVTKSHEGAFTGFDKGGGKK